MIPQSFEQWKHCTEKDCGIVITRQFARERLAVYENSENAETIKFLKLYGENHLQNIIQWLQQIQ